jgi:hypothetical protein
MVVLYAHVAGALRRAGVIFKALNGRFMGLQ